MNKYFLKFIIIISLLSCQSEEQKIMPTDEDLIASLFTDFVFDVYYNQGKSFELLVDKNYLNQGKNIDLFKDWIFDLSQNQLINIYFNQMDIVVDQDLAIVDYTLKIESCREGPKKLSCQTIKSCDSNGVDICNQWKVLKKVNNRWFFYGDQKKIGTHLVSRFNHLGIFLDGYIHDPSLIIKSIKAYWNNGDEISFEKIVPTVWKPKSSSSQIPKNYYPEEAFPWAISLKIETNIQEIEQIHFIRGVSDFFPSFFNPNGEAIPPIELSWDATSNQGGFQIKFLKENILYWQSDLIYDNELNYQGPNLASGEEFDAILVSYDQYGNYSETINKLFILDISDLTPEINTISPTVGTTQGGTKLVIKGKNFLNGVQVLIGSQNALMIDVKGSTEITCYTPSSLAGTQNVIVVNPSGKTDILERSFTYVDEN